MLVRGIVIVAFLLGLAAAFVGCPTADEICNPDPADNTCSGDGDCELGYCATECCWCPRAYSTTQVEDTWCLTRYGTPQPIVDCLKGREERCAGTGPCVCAYNVEAWCNAGKCDLRATTP